MARCDILSRVWCDILSSFETSEWWTKKYKSGVIFDIVVVMVIYVVFCFLLARCLH